LSEIEPYMNDLFRFIMLRPPRVPPKDSVVQVNPSQQLHDKFGDISADRVATRARELQARGTGLIKTAADLKYGAKYAEFLAKLDSAPTDEIAGTLGELVNQTFGQNPQSLVADDGFVSDKALASDTMIVAKLASNGRGFDIGAFNAALRAVAVIESVAAGVANPVLRPAFVSSFLALLQQPEQVPPAPPPGLPAGEKFNPIGAKLLDQSDSDEDKGTSDSLPPLPTKPKGVVANVGKGDLLVVKQRLKRYEGGDVAHIENVLRTESFWRDTRRLDRTQTTVTTETDVTTEEERDTQSTNRYSLQRECANTVKQDSSLKAGVAVSASYGPTVSVKTNLHSGPCSRQSAA
jgi:hypothetical protein